MTVTQSMRKLTLTLDVTDPSRRKAMRRNASVRNHVTPNRRTQHGFRPSCGKRRASWKGRWLSGAGESLLGSLGVQRTLWRSRLEIQTDGSPVAGCSGRCCHSSMSDPFLIGLRMQRPDLTAALSMHRARDAGLVSDVQLRCRCAVEAFAPYIACSRMEPPEFAFHQAWTW